MSKLHHPCRPAFGRRSFLRVAGGSLVLSDWLRSAVARAEGGDGPKRLVVLHRPNGTIAEDWIRNGAPGPILQPFSDVWSYAVALKGVDVRPSNGSTGGDPSDDGPRVTYSRNRT